MVNRTSDRRVLIVNADDFGQSVGINAGVARGHEQGIVTSASLMVRWPASAAAADYARAHPELSVGLHIDFGEWAYRDNDWVPMYQVLSDAHPDTVADEVDRQIAAFEAMLGAPPTHLDSHQHVHRDEPLRSILRDRARTLRVPLRQVTRRARYCGDFYGQSAEGEPFPDGISVRNLLRIIGRLRPGITELGCHPADRADVPSSMYTSERMDELRALCDARVRAAIKAAAIDLCAFAQPREARLRNRF